MSARRRRFYDAFCGKLENISVEAIEGMYLRALSVGYNACIPCLVIRPLLDLQEIRKNVANARAIVDSLLDRGLKVYLRCHLAGISKAEVKKVLPRIRGMCDLVSVEGTTREMLAFASRDRRIDIITLIPGSSPKLYKGDIDYILKYGKFVEVTASSFLTEDLLLLARNISSVRSLLLQPARKKVPILLSSGEGGLKDPRSLLAFAELLLGLDVESVARSASALIEKRLAENLEKRMGIRPIEGVRIERPIDEI
ncbi:hypothetical protein IG193_05615 [Infirmifilum lucidum]|uniref:Uncharacterized protein n=1 Tax=Infirmifilum lucidum TaxID=2776706 RepID=A0A7L9FEY4_9CREN|nr:RNase P subunit p30 family protein [Infirmifilum lucidum]QOJ78247.1 hypothetical protein IG193_05615 [Infirmifilum lucidum]